jgi:hypothetical protein
MAKSKLRVFTLKCRSRPLCRGVLVDTAIRQLPDRGYSATKSNED